MSQAHTGAVSPGADPALAAQMAGGGGPVFSRWFLLVLGGGRDEKNCYFGTREILISFYINLWSHVLFRCFLFKVFFHSCYISRGRVVF